MTRLITALDFKDEASALETVRAIGDNCEWYKVGKELFTVSGPSIVRKLKEMGKNVFLDLKFHDIPNTVSHAVKAAASIGADLCDVHASGGRAMLQAAADAAGEAGIVLVAVTVLTSMDEGELASIGIQATPEEQVRRLALLARSCGVPGCVCSAMELPLIHQCAGGDFITVVPGIRPSGAAADDQKRIMTPAQAQAAGADFIVVGRPITKSSDPAGAAAMILGEMRAVE